MLPIELAKAEELEFVQHLGDSEVEVVPADGVELLQLHAALQKLIQVLLPLGQLRKVFEGLIVLGTAYEFYNVLLQPCDYFLEAFQKLYPFFKYLVRLLPEKHIRQTALLQGVQELALVEQANSLCCEMPVIQDEFCGLGHQILDLLLQLPPAHLPNLSLPATQELPQLSFGCFNESLIFFDLFAKLFGNETF